MSTASPVSPAPPSGPRLSARSRALAGFAVLCAVLMVWGKFAWLHNDAAAEACALGAKSLDCTLRAVLGEWMYRKVFAWVAIAVAGLAVIFPRVWTTGPAILASTFALAFYNADPGAFAAALTVVAIARCK